MKRPRLLAGLGDFAERESLLPDLRRATRSTVAFMVPLLLEHAGWLEGPVLFAAIAAQNVALMDVRGAYHVRVSLLLAKTVVLGGATWLGFAATGSLTGAVLATGVVAFFMGVWRHLSPDYGPSLAAASALVFLIALATPGYGPGIAVLYALGGGLWGVLVQASLWPFRPEHPLRQTAAESWLALGDLFAAMTIDDPRSADARHRAIVDQEAVVRTTLDRTTALLGAGTTKTPLHQQLDALNLTAARLATRVVVFNGELETQRARPDFSLLAAAVQPVLTSLTNTTRTVALALVSRQPSHLATAEVRVQRLTLLIQVLQARIAAHEPNPSTAGQLRDLLRQVAEQLPVLLRELRATLERAGERGAFSLELLDVEAWTIRPLTTALNLRHAPDPTLARFTARLALMLMIGVAIFVYWEIPRGYWLPLTVVVVLQPDYGSTRLRAAQRLLGTVVGGLLASVFLWLRLPAFLELAAIGATIFGFSYYLRKNYAVAVLFITLMIVLLTESANTLTIAFTVERLVATLAGGAMAMLAALLFWPVWEWQRFPGFLAGALRANRTYVELIQARLESGGTYDAPAIAAKRQAESANAMVFSSLQRMAGDPKHQRSLLARAATLANGNQRLTRALTTMAVHLVPGAPLRDPSIARFGALSRETLARLAESVEHPDQAPTLVPMRHALESFQVPPSPPGARTDRDQWVFSQMSRATFELSAMVVAAQSEAA